MFKRIAKALLPKSFLLLYHKLLAILANVIYWFPSRRLIVIGITGTKGKSSTTVMIVRILEEAGFKVGSTNTVFFKIADKEWPNTTKQGMLGRFKLQKMLRQMIKAGCTHAVIEVTSEGIAQSRHWGIAFDIAVFTNLSPEHIEAHGSYAKYRVAKAEIFKQLKNSYRKTPRLPSAVAEGAGGQASLISPLVKGEMIKKIIIVNRMDKEAEYFLQFPADEKYAVKDEGELINLQLAGEFMAINARLAMAVARALGISDEISKHALEKIASIPGRVEFVEVGQDFKVIVDYAHEPRSFRAIFQTGRQLAGEKKVIAVFGATGGGRDAARRPELAKIAAETADYMIVTNEDPYDDDPRELIDQVTAGVPVAGRWREGENWWRIIDRREAIAQALSIARPGDVVLLLGKGSEQVMAVGGGKTVPWSDTEIARELLRSKHV